jgi:hypothetical protein
MTWENCSYMGEECLIHNSYIKKSTCGCNSEKKHLLFMIDYKQQGSIQDIIDQEYGTFDIL